MSEEPSHSVTVTRTRQDFFLFANQLYSRVRNVRIYHIVAVLTLMSAIVLLLNLVLEKRVVPVWILKNELMLYALFMSVMFIGLMLVRLGFMPLYRREYLNENQMFLRPHQLTIDEKGVRETSPLSESFVMWQGIDKIEKTSVFLLIFTDRLQAYSIPLRNFSTPQLADQFYETMLGYWHKAHGRVSS